MRVYEPDPTFRNARREAIVLCVVFIFALVYTLFICSRFGYDRDPAEIVSYLGIPDWVMWGIFAPWTVCVLVTVWFCFVYMADDPLEDEDDGAAESDSSSPTDKATRGDS